MDNAATMTAFSSSTRRQEVYQLTMFCLVHALTGEQMADQLKVTCQEGVVCLLKVSVPGGDKVAEPGQLVLQHGVQVDVQTLLLRHCEHSMGVAFISLELSKVQTKSISSTK